MLTYFHHYRHLQNKALPLTFPKALAYQGAYILWHRHRTFPVILWECVNVDIGVWRVKYQGRIMVLLEVREYMEYWGKVPFSRKRQVGRHHRDFTPYINSAKLHHLPNNTRAGLVLTRTLTRPGWPPYFCANGRFFARAAERIFLTQAIAYQLFGTNFSLSSRRRQKQALLIISNYQQYLNIILFSH